MQSKSPENVTIYMGQKKLLATSALWGYQIDIRMARLLARTIAQHQLIFKKPLNIIVGGKLLFFGQTTTLVGETIIVCQTSDKS